MSNTIELLETIGSDASLRHASGDDLARTLAGMQATEGLQQAAAIGDSSLLEKELGRRNMSVVKSPTQSGYEDDNDLDDGEAPELPGKDDRDPPAV
ncbi:MAG TPA: hypothetical protein VFL78_05220 [Rhodanobacteraceae bacterium]|nr:hypothetical protein [Rhodanobacteraceae bacterium]